LRGLIPGKGREGMQTRTGKRKRGDREGRREGKRKKELEGGRKGRE